MAEIDKSMTQSAAAGPSYVSFTDLQYQFGVGTVASATITPLSNSYTILNVSISIQARYVNMPQMLWVFSEAIVQLSLAPGASLYVMTAGTNPGQPTGPMSPTECLITVRIDIGGGQPAVTQVMNVPPQ